MTFFPPRRRTTSLLLILLIGVSSAQSEIEFIGILATSQSTQFALADTTTGSTDWVMRGGRFSGYTVAAFDPKEETLLLRRDGTELRVRLKDDAKVKASRLELTGTITLGGTSKLEIERATLSFDQENLFPLQDGITYRITPTRRPDGTILYGISIERTLAPNKTERISAPQITTRPGQPFRLTIDELEFSFIPWQ